MLAKRMYLMYCGDVNKRNMKVTSNNIAVNWFSLSDPAGSKHRGIKRVQNPQVLRGRKVEVLRSKDVFYTLKKAARCI